MKQFKFRLERLLQLREAAEKDQARQLGDALKDEETRREQLRASLEKLDAARDQHGPRPNETSPAGTLQNLGLTIDAMAGQARSMEATHAKSVERVKEEQDRFEQARMAKRVIQRLREHRKEAWGVEMSRHEQIENDESGQRGWSKGER